jgi:hypothetical protein
MAVKKGLVIGVAVGGLLYVMWRRRRTAESAQEEPAWQPEAPAAAQPVAAEPVADEPVAADPVVDEPVAAESAADEEITEELDEQPPAEPEVEAVVAAEEPAAAPPPPPRREEPSLRHPGRRVPLTSSGFASKPRAAAFRSSDRPQAGQARISWPGTGGPANQRPKPLRLVPTRARPASLRRSR